MRSFLFAALQLVSVLDVGDWKFTAAACIKTYKNAASQPLFLCILASKQEQTEERVGFFWKFQVSPCVQNFPRRR